jgi:hypothetical protein
MEVHWMNQPNFQAMNPKELRDYFLCHREDRDAFYLPPLKFLEDLENHPKFITCFRDNPKS